MKKNVFILSTTIVMALILTACQSPPEEVLVDTYKFRCNAVIFQVDNLVGDVGDAYTEKSAVMQYLDTFIRKSPRVAKVTLASVPMAKPPFAISLSQVQRAAPKPIGKYTPQLSFNKSENMIWYRKLLRKKIAFWYQSTKLTKEISYVHPVFDKLNPAIILYILKLDFEKHDNPVLFWNVYKRFYTQKLLKQEEEHLRKYFLLKKEAEQKELKLKALKEQKVAKAYYELKLKEVEKTAKERERLFLELQKNKYKPQKTENENPKPVKKQANQKQASPKK